MTALVKHNLSVKDMTTMIQYQCSCATQKCSQMETVVKCIDAIAFDLKDLQFMNILARHRQTQYKTSKGLKEE